MQRSINRILTTHTGSLPRPDDLIAMLQAQEAGGPQETVFAERLSRAVDDIVHQQHAIGLDVINDGEMGKSGYATYVKHRLTGFDGSARLSTALDLKEYPTYTQRLRETFLPVSRQTMACTGPVAYKNPAAVQQDIANLTAARDSLQPVETFLSAASPGVISLFMPNQYYPTHEAYLYALADAMQDEYTAIVQAGVLLQVDCPDLAMGRHIQFAASSLEEFRRHATLHVEALNHALAGIPPDRVRLHLCWGNYEGPHHHDVPLRDIIDIVLQARPLAVSFEAANPRHAHEWQVFEDLSLPEGKLLIPGVIDSTTNYIEHPKLVAERIVSFAKLVGREQVMAGTDCGFSTFTSMSWVEPAIVWAKLQALVEGARLASRQLW